MLQVGFFTVDGRVLLHQMYQRCRIFFHQTVGLQDQQLMFPWPIFDCVASVRNGNMSWPASSRCGLSRGFFVAAFVFEGCRAITTGRWRRESCASRTWEWDIKPQPALGMVLSLVRLSLFESISYLLFVYMHSTLSFQGAFGWQAELGRLCFVSNEGRTWR